MADTYAPRDPDYIDNVRYTERVVDQILRNNPLKNAIVSQGLTKWTGNYVNPSTGNKITHVWIGEFFPADTNIGPGVPQHGFALQRDDSRGGVFALSLYDPTPGAGGGLKQTLHVDSGDGHRLMEEARDGGQSWPEDNVYMGALGNDIAKWPGTTSGTFDTIFEGRVNVVGNRVAYRMFAGTTGGASAEYRLRVEGIGGDVVSATHTLAAGASGVFDSSVDVSASRGNTLVIRWEARRTNGVGVAASQCISVRCFTP